MSAESKTKNVAFGLGLLVVFTCCPLEAYAQSSSSEPPKEVIECPTVDSPQVWSMMRYDNPSVSLNTGSPYITIPLVDENDPDFDFKYSLVYSTPGFRPWEPDNYVGMGWILEGDGVIRREIRGIPDDCQNLPTGPHTASQSRMVSGFRSIYGTTAGVTGGAMMVGGAASASAGAATMAGGAAVAVTGVGAPAGAVAVGAGAATAAGGEATAAAGAYLSAKAAGNSAGGYERGNTSEKETVTFTQGRGENAKQVTVKVPEGYRKTNFKSKHGEPIYKKGRNYISPDRDGHNGGVWKKAKSVEALDSKATRAGTYDENLNFIHK